MINLNLCTLFFHRGKIEVLIKQFIGSYSVLFFPGGKIESVYSDVPKSQNDLIVQIPVNLLNIWIAQDPYNYSPLSQLS